MSGKYQNLFLTGVGAVFTWSKLSFFDIRQRYRRSLIGPWWFTINVAFFVGAMAVVYGKVLNQPLKDYLPYLSIGLVSWQFVSGALLESCSIFIESTHLIKQIKLPMMIYVCRSVFRNFIIFLHAVPVLMVVLILSSVQFHYSVILVPVGILLLALHTLWISTILAFICARFRDVVPITSNIVQLLFFTTPILWKAEQLVSDGWIADINPLYHIFQCLRDPLLGKEVPFTSWVVSLLTLIVGMLTASWVVQRYSQRVAYWV